MSREATDERVARESLTRTAASVGGTDMRRSRHPGERRRVLYFRVPQDLGIFFIPRHAPRVNLPDALRRGSPRCSHRRWSLTTRGPWRDGQTSRRLPPWTLDPPRYQAGVASNRRAESVHHDTRRVGAPERGHEGRLVAIELEREPPGSVAESASVIACLAAECPIRPRGLGSGDIASKRHRRRRAFRSTSVLEDLTRQLNVPDVRRAGRNPGLARAAKHASRASVHRQGHSRTRPAGR